MFHLSLGQSGARNMVETVTISFTPPCHLGMNLEISNTTVTSEMSSLALTACIDLKVVETPNFVYVNIVSH